MASEGNVTMTTGSAMPFGRKRSISALRSGRTERVNDFETVLFGI
jgi:hypothetical protein